MAPAAASFVPALVVVDVQEDFCPPDGALAVDDGRAIVPTINDLLALPFALKIATRDFHPRDHISFAANHAAAAVGSTITVANPLNPAETHTTRLWPAHCIQGSPGARLVRGLHAHRLHHVVDKGRDARVEMYSAFADPFRAPPVCPSALAGLLRAAAVSHVYCVGLAFDYCVRHTALDAAAAGWSTCVVRDATRAVDPAGHDAVCAELEAAGVRVVAVDGPEVRRVDELASPPPR